IASNDSEGEDDIGDDLEIDDPNVRESLATMLFDTVTRMSDSCRAAAVAKWKAAKEEGDKEEDDKEED
ncbi:hypothetical protein BGZ97_011235, partial [Linnemannia gamsii]